MFKKVLIIIIPLIVFLTGAFWMYQRNKNNSNQNVLPTPMPSKIQTTTPTSYLIKGTAQITDVEIAVLESFPVQVVLTIKGDLPDSCTEIDKINQTREDNTFFVTVTTKRPAEAMCAQVITPFAEKINLDVFGLKKGVYKVNVNNVVKTFEFKNDNTLSGQNTP